VWSEESEGWSADSGALIEEFGVWSVEYERTGVDVAPGIVSCPWASANAPYPIRPTATAPVAAGCTAPLGAGMVATALSAPTVATGATGVTGATTASAPAAGTTSRWVADVSP